MQGRRTTGRGYRFLSLAPHQGPERRRPQDRHQRCPTDTKAALLRDRHRRDLCHLHAPQTGSQYMAVFAVNHDDNTQTPHRLHDATLCDPLEFVSVAPARSSHVDRRPNGTGISFFCQYYLRLHPLVHGRSIPSLSVAECCRHTQLPHRARPHHWT